MNIVFMGTSEFAVPTLQALFDSEHRVCSVYTRAPKPTNRGGILTFSPVHMLARAHNVPIITPNTLRGHSLEPSSPDLIVVVSYGCILPPSVLDAPKLGCLNVHASLLPRWRGAAPIARCIEAGDTHTGVSIMYMTAGLDEGPVITSRKIAIEPRATAQTLGETLAQMGARMMLEVISKLPMPAAEQDSSKATYASKLTKEEGRVDWGKNAKDIDAKIRAFTPKPGAFTTYQSRKGAPVKLKILKAFVTPVEHKHAPGYVFFSNGLWLVACGKNALCLEEVQRENKSALTAKSFLNGTPEMQEGVILC